MTTNKCLTFAVKCLPGNYLIINNYIDSMIDHRFRRSKDLFIDNDRQEVIVHCQKYFQKTCISMYYHNKKIVYKLSLKCNYFLFHSLFL